MAKDEENSTSGYEKFMELVKAEMLKVHSEKTVEHALDPRNMGPMPEANGHARITGPCGDTMEIFLKIKQGKVAAASFLTSGCCSTIACGSITTELAKGEELAEVKKINPDTILKSLGGLPEASVHCSVLAANTLKAAIEDYLKNHSP